MTSNVVVLIEGNDSPTNTTIRGDRGIDILARTHNYTDDLDGDGSCYCIGPSNDNNNRNVTLNNRVDGDPGAVLKEYVRAFGDDVIALRGTIEQTQAAARDFKVYFGKVPGKTEGSYTIDHTAGSFVFDPKGQVRLFVRYGGGTDALASDLKLLLEGA